jgi:multidrug efflux pump
MWNISLAALRRPRFVLIATLALVLAGLVLALDFPSTEEPTVPVRVATVTAALPGASVERMEQLVARPIEEKVRELSELRFVSSTVRPGFYIGYVVLHDAVAAERLPNVWQRLRAKISDVVPRLPEGTQGPWVDDEFGRVAVLTLGLTGEGYTAGELRTAARGIRDRLSDVPGVERVSLHGVRDEQITLEINSEALLRSGLSPLALVHALAERNVVLPAGQIFSGGSQLSLTVSGDARSLSELGSTPVPLPHGGAVPLSQLAQIRREAQDPAQVAAFLNGAPTIVIAVSMDPGLNVLSFARTLKAEVHQIAETLPAGLQMSTVTDQAVVVGAQLGRVGAVFVETTLIVLGVVVLFLGWRTGLIVGAIVPATVLGSLVLMRFLGIELHLVSIGAIIIALGLFVDNAIVVAEDMERRLALGEEREQAAAEAGRTMFVPLLVSSLAIILAFLPLALGETATAEYTRSLGIVLAIALLLSLVLAVTVTALLCRMFAKHHAELGWVPRQVDKVQGWYRGKVRWVLAHRGVYVAAMGALLVGALGLMSHLPSELLPPSERRQLQMTVELQPDTHIGHTVKLTAAMSRLIADRKLFPQIEGHAFYVGDGGPRFILALNPPTPAAHTAYAVLSLAEGHGHEEAIAQLRKILGERFPGARIDPKRFSMGSSEAGTAVFRLTGPDRQALRNAADKLMDALKAESGMHDVRDDAEHAVLQLDVVVDQARASAAGVTSSDVAKSLQTVLGGTAISGYREGDTTLPVVVRGADAQRQDAARLGSLLIQSSDPAAPPAKAVPLAQIAEVRLVSQPAVAQRYNQQRLITVSARHAEWTAPQIAEAMQPTISAFGWPAGHMVKLGGEIEEGAEANAAIANLLPVCVLGMFLLFLWQFDSARKSLVVLASVPFVVIGATLALLATGTTLTFMGTLGLLALAGIIVNNAVLLIDAIDEARREGMPPALAIEIAAVKRLRPIVMTKLVCILGLVPLWLFGGAMWTSLAVVMMGGLALGTLITLGLIPALYAIAFRVPSDPSSATKAVEDHAHATDTSLPTR